MLTEEENGFLEYWGKKRLQKKRLIWQLSAGLPLGVLLAAGIFINYFSGWDKRAAMQINISASGVLVVLAGLILIVVFIAVFSAYHRWDMNEQHYKELLAKKGEQ